MKTIDVKDQPILSLSRTVSIALAGVKYRLFRAMVTVVVITVAMSFLMNILSESMIKRAVAETARDEIHAMHLSDQWIAKLSVPQSRDEIIEILSENAADSDVFAEMMQFSGSDANPQEMHELAVQASGYIDFFNALDYGKRRLLAGRSEGSYIFDYLTDATHRQAFFDHLAKLKTIEFPGDPQALVPYLTSWTALDALCKQIRKSQQLALKKVQSQLDGQLMLAALTQADGAFGDVIRQSGFYLPQAESVTLASQAQAMIDRHIIEDTINNISLRRDIAAKENILPADVKVEMIWKLLLSKEHAQWYMNAMQAAGVTISEMSASRLVTLAEGFKKQRLLVRAELATADSGTGFLGMGKRMSWLLFVSMLVCAVGIANAMLMSVTERFREIATLKCLGALDGFIMLVFLIESSILGLMGGLLGSLIGLIIGMSRMAFEFKSLMFQSIPVESLLISGVISVLLGIVLAAVSAVYPSMRAARLAPMEAMRIE